MCVSTKIKAVWSNGLSLESPLQKKGWEYLLECGDYLLNDFCNRLSQGTGSPILKELPLPAAVVPKWLLLHSVALQSLLEVSLGSDGLQSPSPGESTSSAMGLLKSVLAISETPYWAFCPLIPVSFLLHLALNLKYLPPPQVPHCHWSSYPTPSSNWCLCQFGMGFMGVPYGTFATPSAGGTCVCWRTQDLRTLTQPIF